MTDDESVTSGITRREALAGGSAAAVAVGAGLYSDALVRQARAASSGDPRILLGDAATDPDENGEFARNGSDVKVQSGGSVRNFSNISEPGLEPLRSVTASSQAEVAFDQGNIDNTRRAYKILAYGIIPASDNDEFVMQTSADGGSTYESGASDYLWTRQYTTNNSSGSSSSGGGGDSDISIGNGFGNSGNESAEMEITIFQPAAPSFQTRVAGLLTLKNNSEFPISFRSTGFRDAAEVNDAIQFIFNGGNISSGTFDLYGVRTP